MSEKKLDLQELDQILKKNTSELRNPLQGVSFSVFNKKGRACKFSTVLFNRLPLVIAKSSADTTCLP